MEIRRLRRFTRAQAESMFKFLEKVITEHKTPVLPPEYSQWDTFNSLYQHTSEIKSALANFAKGDLDLRVVKKGATTGNLKAILANLSHLAWQFKVAAQGDFSHTVDFMGEFSDAFNLMTTNLARHERELGEKQRELAVMAEELKKEIRRRDRIEAALKESESNYRKLALHDPLTKIYNRSYFNEAGIREVEITRRRGDDMCLLMMDLDKFKRFNDTFGHLSGDAALIHVTGIVQEIQRKTDIFARFGGEEFILLLPQTPFTGGKTIAERLRLEIASRPDPAPNAPEPITISIGVACLSQTDAMRVESAEMVLRELISRADEALYDAKKAGGNCVKIHDPSQSRRRMAEGPKSGARAEEVPPPQTGSEADDLLVAATGAEPPADGPLGAQPAAPAAEPSLESPLGAAPAAAPSVEDHLGAAPEAAAPPAPPSDPIELGVRASPSRD
jgi:diguanylate cyclase (GGDEF)-like protein